MKQCEWFVASSFRPGGTTILAALLLVSLATGASAAPVKEPGAQASAQKMLAELAAKMPLRFEENVGQMKKPEIRYFAQGRGYRLFLGPEEMVFSLGGAKAEEKTVRLHLVGGAERPALVGFDELPTKSNYYLGNDPRAWRTGAPSFAGVRYQNVYPGTDLVFSGNDRRVEQSFFLAAGAEPRRIRMIYEGAATAEVGTTGELILRTPGGELTADRPVAYQVAAGERRTVECRYELLARGPHAHEVGFTIGEYDRTLPLVIDPVFESSTYLGGSDFDQGSGIGVDAAGNVYIAGSTASTDFFGTSVPGGFQSSNGGQNDGFVAKIDPTGTTLLYSTYLGGSANDGVTRLAVDPAGNVYLAGSTDSTDFPGVTAGSAQSSNAGGFADAFVAKLSASGSALLYATYLGGSDYDIANGVAIDSSGNAYVAGETRSSDFQGMTSGSFQPSSGGGFSDAFLTKLDDTGSTIVYSTYLGGSGDDIGNQIAVDTSGNAFITGQTCSTGFPVTSGALETTPPGMSCGGFSNDGFVTKLDPAGAALVYSTFLGGSGDDRAKDIAVDTAGNAHITGDTGSSSFTGVTAGSFQPDNPGLFAAFVTKINAAGNAAVYSTFLGGGLPGNFEFSQGFGITLDAAGNAYATGYSPEGHPAVNADHLQPTYVCCGQNGYVTKFDPTGDVLLSTYLGGHGSTIGYAIAVDSARDYIYVTGQSSALDLGGVAPGSIQPEPGGSGDAFLSRIVPGYLTIDKQADTELVAPGTRISYTLTYTNEADEDAIEASLTETVPDNTVFRPTQSTPGWVCTPDDQPGATCVLPLGTVPAGTEASAVFTVRVKNNVDTEGWRIVNTACAHPGPNCSTVETLTSAAPVLSITKTALFNQARPGNLLRYRIKAFNSGNMDADPVVITDTVPGSAVFDPANSTPGWSCDPDGSAGSVCSFDAGLLPTGSNVNIIFAVNLTTLYHNTACVQVVPPAPELAPGTRARKAAEADDPVCATATTPLN